MDDENDHSKRGGRRKGAGKPPSGVRVEIGTEPLKKYARWNKLRRALNYSAIPVEKFLAQLFRDRVDSPSFDKALENMEAEKHRREKEEDDDTFH